MSIRCTNSAGDSAPRQQRSKAAARRSGGDARPRPLTRLPAGVCGQLTPPSARTRVFSGCRADRPWLLPCSSLWASPRKGDHHERTQDTSQGPLAPRARRRLRDWRRRRGSVLDRHGPSGKGRRGAVRRQRLRADGPRAAVDAVRRRPRGRRPAGSSRAADRDRGPRGVVVAQGGDLRRRQRAEVLQLQLQQRRPSHRGARHLHPASSVAGGAGGGAGARSLGERARGARPGALPRRDRRTGARRRGGRGGLPGRRRHLERDRGIAGVAARLLAPAEQPDRFHDRRARRGRPRVHRRQQELVLRPRLGHDPLVRSRRSRRRCGRSTTSRCCSRHWSAAARSPTRRGSAPPVRRTATATSLPRGRGASATSSWPAA